MEQVLRCVDPGFPRLVFALAAEVGLRGEEQALREDALLFEFGAVQLADDLADGDCDYLAAPAKTGPGAHWTLQHLFYECVLRSSIRRDVLVAATQDLVCVGSAQQVEVRTGRWSPERSLGAARGLNGRQFSAYFRLLMDGTAFAAQAAAYGEAFGLALHVVSDCSSHDRRWADLPSAARAELVTEARQATALLKAAPLVSLRDPATWLDAVLAAVPAGVGAASRADAP